MAAPSGISWGSIYGDYGRLGIYTSVTKSGSTASVNVQVWFWSKYGITDNNNTFYYDAGTNVTSASTSQGSVTIDHNVSSGGGWSTENQTRLINKTYSYTLTTSSKSYKVYTAFKGIDKNELKGKTLYTNKTYTVPALDSYTVKYNANGGSGAPSTQTKWYGKTLVLSSAKPSRTGYSFQGWGTSASATTVSYAAGASYTANASTTLYAVWKVNTYTVKYNANGGSGAPSNQTKTYGVALTLSSTKPTKTNYKFEGWGTSASATTVSYAAGASYTANASTTLYAVWTLAYTEPSISSFKVNRCTSDGTLNAYGTYGLISFKWSCDQKIGTNNISAITIKYKESTATDWTSVSVDASGTSGTVSNVIGNNSLSIDSIYNVEISVTDSKSGTTTMSKKIGSAGFLIDFLSGGKGAAVGKAADTNDIFASAWNICAGEKTGYLDGKPGIYLGRTGYMHLQRTSSDGHPYVGFLKDDDTEISGSIRVNSSNGRMQFTASESYEFFSHIVLNNAKYILGWDTSGNSRRIAGLSSGDAILVGNLDSNINLYGKEYYFNLPDSIKFKPYLNKSSDAIDLVIRTSGYVTNSSKDLYFTVPLARPLITGTVVTATSRDGFALRQEGKYTHGSSATAFAKPDSYDVIESFNFGLVIKASFSTITNVINNDTIGVHWSGKITFS